MNRDGIHPQPLCKLHAQAAVGGEVVPVQIVHVHFGLVDDVKDGEPVGLFVPEGTERPLFSGVHKAPFLYCFISHKKGKKLNLLVL